MPQDCTFCGDDPSISEGQPAAGFDTYASTGSGRLDGIEGASIRWVFKDAGQPGTADTVQIPIHDAEGTPPAALSPDLPSAALDDHRQK